jgi:hypothetical protein
MGKSILVLVMMLSSLGQRAIAQDSNSAASPLIGTWQVKVTLVICGTVNPVPGVPPFSSVLTFARGGTLAEDTTNPSFAPGQRSSGQGVWETTSNDVFNVRSVAFINFATPGFEAGQQIIDQTITYDSQSDRWSAVAAIKFTDTNGSVYRQGCATATAMRF